MNTFIKETTKLLPLASKNWSHFPSNNSKIILSKRLFTLENGKQKEESKHSNTMTMTNKTDSSRDMKMFAAGLGIGIAGFMLYQNYNPENRKDNSPQTKIPGEKMSLETRVLETGANSLQNFAPINAIHAHLCGFHFYSGDMSRQVEAHHFCNHLNEDVHQCVIYDSDKPTARLIGVEYIISEELFKTLSPEEQQYWHSHAYEVKSGMLVAPKIPQVAEQRLMNHIVTTYGKTIHTWQIDKDKLPLGPPTLMSAFVKDGQINPDLLKKRDESLKVSTQEKRKARESIKTPNVHPNADSGTKPNPPIFVTKKSGK